MENARACDAPRPFSDLKLLLPQPEEQNLGKISLKDYVISLFSKILTQKNQYVPAEFPYQNILPSASRVPVGSFPK
jgi:hypothetical protein